MKLPKLVASDLGLPWSNAWRTLYRKESILRDPRCKNILKISGPLLIVGGLLLVKQTREEFIHMEDFPPLMFFVGMLMILGGAAFTMVSDLETGLKEATEKLLEVLEWGPEGMKRIHDVSSMEMLLGIAYGRLEQLGEIVAQEEEQPRYTHTENWVKAKEKFTKARTFMVKVGLVRKDAGDGRFIRTIPKK